MKKTHRSMSEAEKQRLRNELEQMWGDVPPHALANARELAGVQPGKEHEFRIAAVQEFAFELGKPGVPCTAELPQPDIGIKFWLSDEDGDPLRKELHVSVLAGGLTGTVTDRRQFQSDEQAHNWMQYMITYLNRYLPERLRTMALLTVREAIAQSSEVHGSAQTDWIQLAETHGKIVEDKIKESLGVRSGPARLFERKQQYLNFLGEAARACRTGGERFTQERVAEFASKKFNTEKPIDVRMIRQWNKDFTVNWKYWDKRVNRRN